MYRNFDEVIFVMQAASFAKVNACLSKADWNENSVREALTSTDLSVGDVHFHRNDGKLEYATFNCIASFAANEIPGIVAPFFCSMYVEVVFDEKTNQYRTDGGCGPAGMISPIDGETIYDAEGLYNEFRKNEPQLAISLFVDKKFDFESLCEKLGYKSVVLFNAEDMSYSEDENNFNDNKGE